MKIIECKAKEEIARTFSVMRQLRPHLESSDDYVSLVESLMQTEGYRMVALMDDSDNCVALAGFRVKRCLFRSGNPEMHVDDLVTDQAERSKGYGDAVFVKLKEICRQEKYRGIVLDSGLEKTDAHRFYTREGMCHTAAHFDRSRSPSPAL